MMLTRIPGKVRRRVWERLRPISMRLLYGKPALAVERFSSFSEYRAIAERMRHLGEERARIERGLIPTDSPSQGFWVAGFCAVCRCWTKFHVDYQYAEGGGDRPIPNWRERLLCPGCGLNGRMRASFHLLRESLRPGPGASIYMTEQASRLFAQVAARYPGTVGSEFLADGTPAGSVNASGIRREDLTRLTFADGRFDYLLTFEVLEHVPDYRTALRECARVLKPGGTMLVSVPFHLGERTTVRARVGPGGIEHLLPPEYHGDPLVSGDCLCFYHFGWDFIDALKEAGFRDSWSCRTYSRPLSYLGDLFLFVAIR
jgi:hypothetical protein